MDCRTMREKFRRVVMVVVVVWGIVPLWGLMASPPDIKGICLSCVLDTIFFYKLFSLILFSTAIFLTLYPAYENVKKKSLKYDVLKFCAIRSLGLEIRSHRIAKLHNSFPGTAIRYFDLHNSFPLTAIRYLDETNSKSEERIAQFVIAVLRKFSWNFCINFSHNVF